MSKRWAMFDITNSRTTYLDAHAGILVMHDVDNPATCPELERHMGGLCRLRPV
jgi:hypothetical protein